MPTRCLAAALVSCVLALPAAAQTESQAGSPAVTGPAPQAAPSAQSATGANNRKADAQATGSLATQPVPVSRLKALTAYSGDDKKIGPVLGVVADDQGGLYVSIDAGHALVGSAKKEIFVPAGQAAVQGDRLVTSGLTDQEVRRLPGVDRRGRAYRDVEDGATVSIPTR